MELQLVTEGLRFPEGPVAMADGSIVLVEIEAKVVSRITPDGKRTVIAEVGGGPNGAAIGPDRALYICNNGGAFEFFEQGGLLIPGPTPASHTGGMIQRLDLAAG